MPNLMTVAGSLLVCLATLYAWAALLCRPRSWRAPASPAPRQPVTVLKPLCGLEPRLEENLATLFDQDYPDYQIVFGVRDADDPAIGVVRSLARRYPLRDIEVVVDARAYGSNRKVSNLMNMAPAASHPWLVIADSDIAVTPDYLGQVTAPLADPHVGIVTCLYRGRAVGGFWSRVGALFIDTWFAPSVRVASACGSSAFGFGATIALRSETLQAIGGFAPLRNRLADDFWLGQLTRERGLRTVLSSHTVTTDVAEASFAALWSRERRWMQTIRSINPPGYAFTFVTFTFPMLAAGLWLAPTAVNAAIALLGAAARCSLPGGRSPAYAPLRDGLLLLTWLSGFAGRATRWRRHTLAIDNAAPKHQPRGSPR
jgi:ceramide glucosyltransferase